MNKRRRWWREFGVKAQGSREGALISRGSLLHCIVPLLGDSDTIIIFGSLSWDNANTDSIPQPQTQSNILLSFKQQGAKKPQKQTKYTGKQKERMQMTWLMWFFDEHMRQEQKDIFDSEFAQENAASLTPASGIQLDVGEWIHNNNWIQASLISPSLSPPLCLRMHK